MKIAISVFLSFLLKAAVATAEPAFPLRSGDYDFRLIDAEYEQEFAYPARVSIQGMHIKVVTTTDDGPFHRDQVFADGVILWHENSGQWIIGHSPKDREAEEVGGCSGGPLTIDLERRVIWYC